MYFRMHFSASPLGRIKKSERTANVHSLTYHCLLRKGHDKVYTKQSKNQVKSRGGWFVDVYRKRTISPLIVELTALRDSHFGKRDVPSSPRLISPAQTTVFVVQRSYLKKNPKIPVKFLDKKQSPCIIKKYSIYEYLTCL